MKNIREIVETYQATIENQSNQINTQSKLIEIQSEMINRYKDVVNKNELIDKVNFKELLLTHDLYNIYLKHILVTLYKLNEPMSNIADELNKNDNTVIGNNYNVMLPIISDVMNDIEDIYVRLGKKLYINDEDILTPEIIKCINEKIDSAIKS